MPKAKAKIEINCSNYRFFTVLSSDTEANYFLTRCKDYQFPLVRLQTTKLLLNAKIINFDTLLAFDEKQSEVFTEAASRSETYLIELLAINPLFKDVATIDRKSILAGTGSAYSHSNLEQVADFLRNTSRTAINTLHMQLGRAAVATGVITLDQVQSISKTEQAQEFIDHITKNDALMFVNKLHSWFDDLQDTVGKMLEKIKTFIFSEKKEIHEETANNSGMSFS